ncbi:MAG: beta strand repeat-containing protein, partial [Bacteroidota bacterium]
MKKNYLIFIFTVLLFSSYSQTFNVDYDNSSKWFLGLNVGAAWNTTDVTNKTDAGWGIILGKSYGFKSYSPFTFDIRARYLRGFWYGQDTDTSSLAGYTGSALSGYSSQGFTVHNFQSDVHRLGLELAIHLNSITSRSGWDPYLFGGVGLTWHQTYSDLLKATDSTTGSVYDYSSMLGNLSNVEDQLDGVYDSPLDGYNSNTYNVAFMPSLGVGLGYHIGKRVTLGVEHKTTFTLRDDFDGLVSTTRQKNDLYHYTSLYLRFRFRGRQPNGNVSNTPCYTPTISVVQPTAEITVTNPQYTIEANLTEITNSNQISVVNSIGQNIPFNFNSSSKKLTANVLLIPGQNSYTIRVNNRCGSDSKVVSLNFLNCSLPSGVFTSPTSLRDTVRTSAFTLSAAISGITSVQGIKILQNNVVLNGYSFNSANGLLQASVNLLPGRNTFTLELFNACGNNTINSEVFYNDCVNPIITLLSPTATGTTVNTPQFVLSALVSGVTNLNQVVVSQNNIPTNGFTLTNSNLSLNALLNQGINTFTITISTRCGSVTQIVTVNYQTCNAPIITVESPLTNTTVRTSNQTVKAKVINIDSKQNLLVSLNGLALKNINYTKASNSLEFPVSLTNGVNTITITATNSCGADVETITIINNPCTAPKVTLGTMSNSVNNSAYSYTATILNQVSSQGINLTMNGSPINYSFSANLLSTSVNLQNGINTFVLTVSNECGTDSKTWVVTNTNCITPSIILENPTASGITVNTSTYNFKSSVIGVSSAQEIQFLVNNSPASFNYSNGIVTSTLNLNVGANSIKLIAQNPCGNDVEELVINFQNCEAPGILINQPSNSNYTTNQASLALNATISNVNGNQGVTAKINGIGFPYQLNSNVLTATVNLQPGANTILLTAANTCGTDVKAINVNYDNCIQPKISISNNTATTTNGAFVFNASVTGTNLNQGITFTHNGNSKSFTLNGSALSSSVTLTEGVNIFTLSAVNSCGNDTKTYSINYQPCLSPIVLITNPASNNLSYSAGNFIFQAQVSHINTASQVNLVVNGVTTNNFTYNNDQIVSTINLVPGNNTIKVTVTSTCGTDTKVINITGQTCDIPVITINSPINNSQNTSSYSLVASVSNVTTNQGITLKLNGTIIPFQLVNNQITASVTLQPGVNTLVLVAANSCGSDTETNSINFNSCVQPQVTLTNTATNVSSSQYTFTASVLGSAINEGISLLHNGNIINYTLNGNSLLANLNLTSGSNVISLTVTNACGRDAKSYTVNYTSCLPPVVSFSNPTANNQTFNVGEFTIQCQVLNVTSSNQITLTVNGNVINNLSLNNGQLLAPFNLIAGNNLVVITVITPCGSDSQNFNIIGKTCEAPIVTINSSTPENVTNASYNLQASLANVQSTQGIYLSVNGNLVTNYAYSNGILNANLNLAIGLNTISIVATNECGNATKTITINYQIPVDNNVNNGNNGNTGGGTPEETMVICVIHQGRNGNSETITIPVSQWPQYQSLGATEGPCNQDSNGNSGNDNQNNSGSGNNNSNGNNGHGNNTDGVDSSNPGQGGGGPNGVNDPSGNVDDESTGSGAATNNSNNSSTENQNGTGGNPNQEGSTNGNSNQNGTNSNSGGSNTNGAGGNNSNSENTNGNNQQGSGGGNNSGGNDNQKNQQINNSGITRGGSKPTINQNNSGGNKPSGTQNNTGGNKPTENINNQG